MDTHCRFTAICPGLPGSAGTRRDIHPLTPESCCGTLSSFWIFWGMGKIIEACSPPRPDHRCPHLHHPTNFTPDALPAATLPIYPGLGQAPNMLDYIRGGLVYACMDPEVKRLMVNVTGLSSTLLLRFSSICETKLFHKTRLMYSWFISTEMCVDADICLVVMNKSVEHLG